MFYLGVIFISLIFIININGSRIPDMEIKMSHPSAKLYTSFSIPNPEDISYSTIVEEISERLSIPREGAPSPIVTTEKPRANLFMVVPEALEIRNKDLVTNSYSINEKSRSIFREDDYRASIIDILAQLESLNLGAPNLFVAAGRVSFVEDFGVHYYLQDIHRDLNVHNVIKMEGEYLAHGKTESNTCFSVSKDDVLRSIRSGGIPGVSLNEEGGILIEGYSNSIAKDSLVFDGLVEISLLSKIAQCVKLNKQDRGDMEKYSDFIGVQIDFLDSIVDTFGRESKVSSFFVREYSNRVDRLINDMSNIYAGDVSVQVLQFDRDVDAEEQLKRDVYDIGKGWISKDKLNRNFPSILLKDVPTLDSIKLCDSLKTLSESDEVYCAAKTFDIDLLSAYYSKEKRSVEEKEIVEYGAIYENEDDEEEDIEIYQIVLLSSLILFFTVFASVWVLAFMDMEKDTLLYRTPLDIEYQREKDLKSRDKLGVNY